jgi:hypothetical protein
MGPIKDLILAKKMANDHALKMQASHNIYLSMASNSIKYAIYIVELEPIQAARGTGVCLSWRQNVAAPTPL